MPEDEIEEGEDFYAEEEEIRTPLEEAVADDEIDPAEEGFVRGYQEERDEEWDED